MNALALADESRTDIGSLIDPTTRGKLGQFMTPAPVATFMAGLFQGLPDDIHLLDAGAGLGALSAALLSLVIVRFTRPIDVDCSRSCGCNQFGRGR